MQTQKSHRLRFLRACFQSNHEEISCDVYVHDYHMCVCVYAYIHICMYACMCAYIYICGYTCKYVYAYVYIHPSIHPSIHPYIHTYLHTYMPTYVRRYHETRILVRLSLGVHACSRTPSKETICWTPESLGRMKMISSIPGNLKAQRLRF